jgi:hypothetical protein
MPGDILDVIDGALRDHAVSADAMRWSPDPETLGEDDTSLLLRIDVSGFVEAMQRMSEAIAALAAPFAKMRERFLYLAPCVLGHDRPRDRHRCPKCNPRGNPGPLAVNGHEHNRRRKARQRRKASS